MKYCRYCGRPEQDETARFCESCGKEFSQSGNTRDKILVKTKAELIGLIEKTIQTEGFECDLNFIDVSNINDMSNLFQLIDPSMATSANGMSLRLKT